MLISEQFHCWMCSDPISKNFVLLNQKRHSEPIWTICIECFNENRKCVPLDALTINCCAICKQTIYDSMFNFIIYVVQKGMIGACYTIHDYCCHEHIYQNT